VFDAGSARITNREPVGNEVKLAAIMWRIFRATEWRITEFPTLLLIIKPQRAASPEFERWRYPTRQLVVERSPLFVALAKSALLEIRAVLASIRKIKPKSKFC
jgi:hypothetical protein